MALVLQSYLGGDSYLKSVCAQPLEANAVGDGVDGNYVAARLGRQVYTLNECLRDLTATAIVSLIVVSRALSFRVGNYWPGASSELTPRAA